VIASAGMIAGVTMSLAATAAVAAPSGRAAIASTRATVAPDARSEGAVASATRIPFVVTLAYRNTAGATAAAKAVSDPTSPRYRSYYTAKGFEAQFAPTEASVAKVTSWLRSEGLTVGSVTPDRLNVSVTGTASQVEHAFGVSLATYDIAGRTTRVATTNATVPAAFAGSIAGVAGLSEVRESVASTTGQAPFKAQKVAKARAGTIPQPGGFRNPPVCSKYYGQKRTTSVPSYGSSYGASLPLAVCGYIPQQFQSAYGLKAEYAKGITGKGVTVAIVDAYVSPTLRADAQEYYNHNDPGQALESSQFSETLASSFDDESACVASGWSGEQTLDVEAVHATAPGARILYAGAKDCTDVGLFGTVEKIVDNGSAQVITNSYGDTAGDLLTPSSDRTMLDNVLTMAAATGIGVQFSAGDEGDDFTTTGLVAPDYPASSPDATAVGGTSLAVGSAGTKLFETGWSTGKSFLCTATFAAAGGCTTAEIGTYTPGAPGAYDYGGGGGTSYNYSEPYYQTGVVPKALADRNQAADGPGTTGRVEPDISMDADPTTGMLVGETQTFPNGVYYDQYRIGGTSLASPLLAGVFALADQASGTPLGFVNPALYKSYSDGGSAIYDVKPSGSMRALFRVDYLNGLNNEDGTFDSVRTLDYQATEEYCDGTDNCASRPVAISTGSGFDSMTGLGSPDPGFVTALSKF
jgi:subtilase family serine protease